MPEHPFREEIFRNMQFKPPVMQLEAVSSHPATSYLGEETDSHLATASFQGVLEDNKVPPGAASKLKGEAISSIFH